LYFSRADENFSGRKNVAAALRWGVGEKLPCTRGAPPATLRPVATADLQSSLTQFAAFARSLKGDEKGEAQTFLDHFFRALGHEGVIEAGATFEFRIAKKPGSAQLELIQGASPEKRKGGKKFADLLWPDRVLIEMKSRGEHLEKHYDQAFNYWTHIVPKRPPYVILCNFDEFWIYDFNEQLFDPVDCSAANLATMPQCAKPIIHRRDSYACL
jgi:hypothetical protein